MGGDFQQYRANVFCGRQDCVHASNFGKYFKLIKFIFYLYF